MRKQVIKIIFSQHKISKVHSGKTCFVPSFTLQVMLPILILLTTLVVAIPTGEAGIQSLAKALSVHDHVPKEVQEKVSYDIHENSSVHLLL